MRLTRGCLALVAMLAPGLAAAQDLPTGWATANIGGASPSGGATFVNGVFTVNAGGNGLSGTSDQFRAVYRQLTGDGTVVVKVANVVGRSRGRQGIVLRESLAAGSRSAALLIDAGGDDVSFLYRQSTGGKTYSAYRKSGIRGHVWLKLTRAGGSVAAAISGEGTVWASIGSVAVPMGSTVYAGLAVTSQSQGVDNLATFSNVSGVAATTNTAQNVAPTVSLATPAGPFIAPASITLNATAADSDGTVARVDFYQGTTLLGSDASSPYAFAWTNVAAGSYALRAVAVDDAGASGQSATVGVTVGSPNQAPTVSLATPAGPFTAPASIALNATAADSDGTVARVDFYQGTTLLNTDSSSPFAFTWSGVTAGTYSLRAVAFDNTGASGQSATVTITVATAANQLPSVSLAVPGGPFTAPASITLNATASDSDGTVARVDFYRNGVLIGSDSSSPYSFAWTNAAAGAYSLRADAIDNTGANGTSATIDITVSAPSNIAPTVSLTAPGAGSSVTGPATITVSATASDADGTIARVEFYQGTALIGSDASSPYSVAWSSVPAGSYTFTAVAFDNSGASTRSAGVTATVTAPQAPTVSLTSPVSGASFVGPASVAMTASASDADGTVARVDFYQGMTLLGTDSSSPYAFAWTNVAAGMYALTAIAVDDSGLSTASSTVQVEVTAANLPQAAIWTPSADDATAVSTYVIEVFPNGVNPATANPVATQDAGKPAQVNGEYVSDIRTMIGGLPSGTYVATVTAVGTTGSAQSAPSPTFSK